MWLPGEELKVKKRRTMRMGRRTGTSRRAIKSRNRSWEWIFHRKEVTRRKYEGEQGEDFED